ncbi:MAG: molybdopterin molybdotransferase MoeA [Sterolibacterium sp.]|jgi:molybdopterin molybdotransferase|nr:molybdopterin molybdotransferase MoeA [Sterolibacterium sp.]
MSLLSFDDALQRLLEGVAALPLRETEQLPLPAALGRVLAQAQQAEINVPAQDNSAMDGYAVRVVDVPQAGTCLPVAQRIPAGSVGHALQPGTAARIFTGAPVPVGADAIVMQEACEPLPDAGQVRIQQPPQAGDWIRRLGEDIRQGEPLLAAGTRLNAAQLGLAASVGIATLPVYRRLRVGLLSTGNELLMPGQVAPADLPPGSIYNSNRFLLQGLLARLGCEVGDLGTVPDNLAATRVVLREAASRYDLVLSSGGVSVGEEDHVKPAVQAEGELALWKIAIKPGKPLAFGFLRAVEGAGDGQAQRATFIGLPGNPVASFVTFVLLVRPCILKLQGASAWATPPRALPLRAAFDWPRADARREFLRARFDAAGELVLHPNQSSGVLTSVDWADGLIDNPPGQVIRRGDTVRFLPWVELLN